ncbi:zygotic DNA replication licensing factor mcm3-like isoform X4 [Sipha flava]|uniref:DNA replication licensing factor MCM3 n=1 Tax=Sipha flava TaxID=143950 RepID=A0A8B8GDG7_9HEMI|nr:zygotic DNA replication licensing factor mcm3-like isoform X4 [Sipha flava]XP_025420723.1 zygotic DNA replication licensing factor mcm3-like isoform X4 [Sipha flava]XP_025420724.1 zygotic DNA replication licensing factor mcm3-like isoform X4 [Sipha flava]
MEEEIEQRLRDTQKEYYSFLDDEENQNVYHKKVKLMIDENSQRLLIDINDLRKKNPNRTQALLTNTFEEQFAFERALKEYVANIDSTFANKYDEFFVAFEGSFGSRHVTPRTLNSKFLGNLVCLEGIVTKCSLIRPKIVKSVHFCPVTKKTIERRYTDMTSTSAFPSSTVYPTKDDDGNPLETEYGLSVYKDHQTITIQEMPEKAPAGQLPRYVDIICDNDLVDCCKPGDRVQVVGSYRCLPAKQGGYTTGNFRTILIANNVSQLSKDSTYSVSREDVFNCRKLSRKKGNIFNLLAHSIAPSIYGHIFIKKAILCLLLGGIEKILPNGTRLRGDINMLLIGDPSVAKSQLLRYVLCAAPRAVATTGRGSSGVGLTAAVTTDQETGDRRLEAGAMVLADRGVVCIDEFDKMSDMDRTAIHEVMEQGRVSISKAGIHARLNARCSVLAAANPVYGRYDQFKTPMENIGLQDSLLSRFDLLFVILDTPDSENDRMISEHVVRIHRYRDPKEQDGEALPMGSGVDILSTRNLEIDENDPSKTRMFEKYEPLLHGARNKSEQTLSSQFMRKYIHIAKCVKPVLTEQASEVIAEEYSRLRSQEAVESDAARTQPVTVRTLETLIRLSTAHAKARLSKNVEQQDANAAIELVQFAYFKKVLEKPKRKRHHSDEESDEEKDVSPGKPPKSKPRTNTDDPYSFQDGEDADTPQNVMEVVEDNSETVNVSSVIPPPENTSISPDRYKIFKLTLSNIFQKQRIQSIHFIRMLTIINEEHATNTFTENEAYAAIYKMMDANFIMFSDGIIFLI